MSEQKTISILGCGWLGLALGKHLTEKGYLVQGSNTSSSKKDQLRDAGIRPYLLIVTDEKASVNSEQFFESDVLIISLPPRRIEGIESYYFRQIQNLLPLIEKHEIKKVLFISSTSVYTGNFQIVREEDVLVPEKSSGRALLLAEELLRNSESFQTTILRLGGLIGADRNPARFLQRTKVDIAADAPVNLIHQDDCVGIIDTLIEKHIWGETLNACCPEHPTKKEFYGRASDISGLEAPSFSNRLLPYKIVNSEKLIGLTGYQFIYPSPMNYLDSL